MKCSMCSNSVTEKVEEFSKDKFGIPLCMKCQQEELKRSGKTIDYESINRNAKESPREVVKKKVVEIEEEKKERYKNIEPRFIINLQGKDFILFEGLLDIAHKKGIKSIVTEMIENTNEVTIFKAEVTMEDGSIYTGFGDTTPNNVNKLILVHKIRMAETRAVARALRFATNVGLCSLEELGGD